MRAPRARAGGRVTAPALFARLVGGVAIETYADGEIVVLFDGYPVSLGVFGAGAADCLQGLRAGLSLGSLPSDDGQIVTETDLLVRRLARHRLLEYRLARSSHGEDLVVIEPQVSDYWPRTPQLGNADKLVLSRFAYIRRRGQAIVLESPRAGALFKICKPQLAAFIAALASPQQVKQLRRRDDFPGIAFLALLTDCRMVVNADATGESDSSEDGHDLAVWEFHDLLFHVRSTAGRHANAVGGLYPHAGVIAPLPAVRPVWPGKQIDLGMFLDKGDAVHVAESAPVAKLLRERRSTRTFDDRQPITLGELSLFLDRSARILARLGETGDGDSDASTVRPYPSAGASYGLELYVTAHICEGLARDLYHYDAGAHALVPIGVAANAFDALLAGAAQAMGVAAAPQILITIAARFGRVSWKYSAIAYALILKDVGVLTQTLYLTATEMRLGGCAIGIADIDLFARMTGLDYHVESPVGQFAIGRSAKPGPLDAAGL